MAKRKRRKRKEEHINETWLLPYSDLMTLLVALFIVLFASSSVDSQKFEALSRTFSAEFMGGSGFFDKNNNPFPIDGGTGVSEGNKDSDSEKNGENDEAEAFPRLTEEQLEEQKRVAEIQARINAYVKEHGLEEEFVTDLTIEGLSITIRDNVLFDSGKANIRPENIQTAQEISKLLEMDVPRSIIISGHTDNVPMHNWEFSSNWDLSVMRAVNFMEVLLENKNLNPALFSAAGYGEYHPVATNDTAEGRAKNRRVEILILPRTSIKANQ